MQIFFVGFPVASSSSSSSFGRNFRCLRLRIASGPFEWTKAADRSLRKIKEKLTEAPMPALTNFNFFRWTCDASHRCNVESRLKTHGILLGLIERGTD